jgi:hypothetical protein
MRATGSSTHVSPGTRESGVIPGAQNRAGTFFWRDLGRPRPDVELSGRSLRCAAPRQAVFCCEWDGGALSGTAELRLAIACDVRRGYGLLGCCSP